MMAKKDINVVKSVMEKSKIHCVRCICIRRQQ